MRMLRRSPALIAALLAAPLVVFALPQAIQQDPFEPPSMYNWEYPNTPSARARMANDPNAYRFERALFGVTARARAVREAIQRGEMGRAAAEAAGLSPAVSGTFNFPVIVGAFAAPDSARPFNLTLLNDRLWDVNYVDPDGKHVNGSVHDYYDEISYGRLDLTGDTYGYVQADSAVGYYVDQAGAEQAGFMDWLDQMISTTDATVDFSQYDGDGDGYVDTLVLVHNLVGAESQNVYAGTTGFWSHRWGYRWVNNSTSLGGSGNPDPYETLDDDPNSPGNGNATGKILINDYVVQPLVNSDLSLINIGVYAHELGHAFGLPDFYDTDGTGSGGESEGLGHWGLMATGSWLLSRSPAHMSAISKDMLGWITLLQITDRDTMGLGIPRIFDNEFAVKVKTSQMHPSEYFLIENRQAVGFDEFLHNSGLLIYHVNDQVSTNNRNPNDLRWALEQADGLFNLEGNDNRGDGGDPWPGLGNKTRFSYDVNPSSATRSGVDSYVDINLTSGSQDTMWVDLFATPAFLLTAPGDDTYISDPTPQLTWEVYSPPGGWGTLSYEVQLDTLATFATAALDSAATNSLDWAAALNERTTYYWRVRAFDSLGNSRLNSGGARQFVLDAGPPEISLGALRNPVVRDQLDIFMVATEPLLTYSMTADSSPLTLSTVTASAAFIRVADYLITGPGTIDIHADGQDPAGNSGSADATLTISAVSAGTGGDVMSADGLLLLEIPAGTVRSDVLAAIMNGDEVDERAAGHGTAGGRAGGPRAGRPVSPVFWVDLPDRVPGRKMNLTLRWEPGSVSRGEMPVIWRQEGANWVALRTAVDLSAGTATAQVEDLGSFQLRIGGEPPGSVPARLALEPAYPNPFNPSTRIAFTLPAAGPVKVTVLNIRGQRVRVLADGLYPAGRHLLTWDGRDASGRQVASGIYLYVLETPAGTRSRKMTLIR